MTEHNGHNGHNGKSSSPLETVARDVRQVAHDVVELAELQAIMARIELQGWWKQFIVPIALVTIAGVIAACCVLILLVSAALQLSVATSLSVPLSLAIVACAAGVLASGLGFAAYSKVKKARGPLQQSKQEFSRNLRWIKTALKTSKAAASEHSSETN